MSFPITITVNGTLSKIDGTPEKGYIVFQAPINVLSGADDSVVVPSYKVATLGTDGSFSLALPASNDPNWNPNNWVYRVTEHLSSGKKEFTTIVPYDAAGGVYDYSRLVPAIDVDAQLYAPYNHTHAGGGGGAVTSIFGRTGAVVAQTGDYTKTQVGLGNVDNTSDLNKPISTATQTALNGKATPADITSAIAAIDYPVDSVAGKTGAVTLVKGDVGLGNVDNTSDASKPVSTAQQTALDLKVDKTAYPGLLVLNVGDPIPGGTATGTVIVRV